MLHGMSYPLDFVLSNFYNLEMVFSYKLRTNSSMTSWCLVWFLPGKRKGKIFLCRQTNDLVCCLRGKKTPASFWFVVLPNEMKKHFVWWFMEKKSRMSVGSSDEDRKKIWSLSFQRKIGFIFLGKENPMVLT